MYDRPYRFVDGIKSRASLNQERTGCGSQDGLGFRRPVPTTCSSAQTGPPDLFPYRFERSPKVAFRTDQKPRLPDISYGWARFWPHTAIADKYAKVPIAQTITVNDRWTDIFHVTGQVYPEIEE